MRKNSLYKHINICEADYLVSFGQAAADRKKAFRLNDSGVFIWHALDRADSFEKLLELCRDEYEWDENETAKYAQGIKAYIDMLRTKGILAETGETDSEKYTDAEMTAGSIELSVNGEVKEEAEKTLNSDAFGEEKTVLNIAGVEVAVNIPEEMLPELFEKFIAEKSSDSVLDHLSIEVRPEADESYGENQDNWCIDEGQTISPQKGMGSRIIETDSVDIFDCEDGFNLLFHQNKFVKSVYVAKSGREVVVYCTCVDGSEAFPEFPLEMSVAIRMCFLNLVQKHNMLAVHSASVLFNDKLVLFSAPSGTGKSTQARLWSEAFAARQINGDFNLLHVTDRGTEVHGTPWCGSSGICENSTHILGFVAFLKQGEKNEIVEKAAHEKALSLLNRSFSPNWTEEMLLKNAETASTIADKCDMCEFICLPDISAVECLKERIEK